MLAGKVSRDIFLVVSKRVLVRCYQFLLTLIILKSSDRVLSLPLTQGPVLAT